MNRSFQAFAVLLVSLAGGMLAATWTSSPSLSRRVALKMGTVQLAMHCSCDPDSLQRYEEGCARDKTTGELYGCGIGLGMNAANGKSVISRTPDFFITGSVKSVAALYHCADGKHVADLVAVVERWKSGVSALQPELLSHDSSSEEDYAAAELAAASFDPDRKSRSGLNFGKSLGELPTLLSSNQIHESTERILQELAQIQNQAGRLSRLWLVEAGLHRQWDNAVELDQENQRLASFWRQFPHDDLNRWFENFPQRPSEEDSLRNDDPSLKSRRMILAAANVLESLSDLLHQTAENLARQAEQNVAKSHSLKSEIEGRR